MGSRKQNFYNKVFQQAGYAELALQVQDLWLNRQREAATALIPDDLVLKTNLLGTKERALQYRARRLRSGKCRKGLSEESPGLRSVKWRKKDMPRKSKQSKRKKNVVANLSLVDTYLDLVGHQILQGNYIEAVATCERLLSYLPQRAQQRIDVLDQLGTAQAMLQNFPQSYAAYTEALSLDPRNAILWFNRGMASRFTSRFGQSLRDYERAKQLTIKPELAKKLEEELAFARELAEKTLKLRGPDFTLDQLVEQEDLFQNGLQLMAVEEWKEAEQAFQASITMDDCLPQPWGNLGISLIMQERYDEAEAALKRALVIDPQYALAKSNLKALPEIRRTGLPASIDIRDPFKSSKLKQSITFIKE